MAIAKAGELARLRKDKDTFKKALQRVSELKHDSDAEVDDAVQIADDGLAEVEQDEES